MRHQLYLSDLTAVAFLKDPKHKRQNVFGLFSPSRNFHFEAPTAQEAEAWVGLIRQEARIEEEEEEMFLASPAARRNTPGGLTAVSSANRMGRHPEEMAFSSSPEPVGAMPSSFAGSRTRRRSSYMESSGLSGNELASHSDFSDNEGMQRLPGTSFESLALQTSTPEVRSGPAITATHLNKESLQRSSSRVEPHHLEQDPDRVIWQGWLYFLRAKGGVKQWKHLWGVLRPRNLILYKNESEYTAHRIISLSAIVNVVDIDPMSKSKTSCLQIITEEKSYRFATHDEESLVQCIGAFKSLLAKRKELETRAAVSAASGSAPQEPSSQ